MKIANWKPFDPVTSFVNLDIGTVFASCYNSHLCLKVSDAGYFDFEDNELYDCAVGDDVTLETASVIAYNHAKLDPGIPNRKYICDYPIITEDE